MKSFLDCNAKSSGKLKARQYNNSSSNNAEAKRLTRAVPSNRDLDCLSLMDLTQLEQHFRGYLGQIRSRKDELLWKELGDLKEQVIKVQRSRNGNPDILEESMNSGLFEMIGSQNSETQGDEEHCYHAEASVGDGSPSLWPDISEGTNKDNQELHTRKRYKPTIKPPARIEEFKGEQPKNGIPKLN